MPDRLKQPFALPLLSPRNQRQAPPTSLLRQQHRRHWRIFAAAALLVGGIAAYERNDSYTTTTANEQARLTTLARVIDTNLQQQLRTIDQLLEDLAGSISTASAAERRDLNKRLALLVQVMPGVRALLVTDAQGTVVHASRDALIGLNVEARSYFSEAKRAGDLTKLYVTQPFETRFEKHWVLPIARIVPDPNGGFGGVIQATIDPEFVSTLLASTLHAPDAKAMLFHGSGQLFQQAPDTTRPGSTALAQPETLFSRHLASDLPSSLQTGIDGISNETRVAALRTIAPQGLNVSAPLVVSVSRGVDAIYAPWYSKMFVELGGLLAIMFGSAMALRHYQRRQTETELRFGHLIDHAPYGIMLIDAGGTIRRVNKAFTA